MKSNRRMIVSIIEMIVGGSLFAANCLGAVDEFWGGMGTALMAVGLVFLVRSIRYQTDNAYRQHVDIATEDERHRYIRNKAWAWAGYIFVMAASVATIILKLLDQELLMTVTSGCVCLMVTVYWITYMILKKKY